MKTNLLITGATGNTGKPLVVRLTRMNVPFRAMVHSADKIQGVKNGLADVVVGDFGDSASVERALDGIERVYLLSPPSPDQFATQAGFVDSARKRGVKHLVKLSALGTASDSPVGLLRAHAQIEDYIKKSGIAYTFLRPHFFMENLLMNCTTVQRDGAIYSPLGDARISPVSVQDIAAVAAAVLTTDGHAGMTYQLTGPESLTYGEIASTLSEILGKPVRYSPVPFDAAQKSMVMAGMPEWFAEDLVRLMKTWAAGEGDLLSPDVERIAHRKPLSVREFFKMNKYRFIEPALKAA